LGQRITAFIELVAQWLGKAISALPNPQGVFADAGVALHGSDGQMGLGMWHVWIHGKIVIGIGWFFEVS
jgi:hypothetical protein